jgi:hypothetical protein
VVHPARVLVGPVAVFKLVEPVLDKDVVLAEVVAVVVQVETVARATGDDVADNVHAAGVVVEINATL